MKTCPTQELCLHFESGDNKPKNHDVRNKFPCVKFLDMSCEESVRIQLYLGETLACDINKISRIKRNLRDKEE